MKLRPASGGMVNSKKIFQGRVEMLRKPIRLILTISFLLFHVCSASGETHNLNLDQCLQITYQNNKTLLQLQEKINSAGYKIEEAKSGFYPQFSFSGSYTRLGSVPQYDFGGMSFKLGSENNYNLGLSLEQPLFTWGRIKNSYDISKQEKQTGDQVWGGLIVLRHPFGQRAD
jgi:hypothetical protein